VYKFVGFGLLGFLALLIIPVSSSTQSDDPSMYGMATISLKDESGNILIENQMHNEVVDTGTATMMSNAFEFANPPGATFGRVTGLCVSNADAFSIADTETFTTFNGNNTIDNPFLPCQQLDTFIFTDTSASTGVRSFTAGTAFADGTTITGIGVCAVDKFGPVGLVDCNTSAIGTTTMLFGVIDIVDTAVPGGKQLDVTYTLNLD
jgi:hypothetical protein